LILHAFCDSNWAGNLDDCHSRTGIGIVLGSSLISWTAKKQSVSACSSTEAEYRAMALAITNLSLLRMLFKDLGVPLLSTYHLWCDNIEALAIASNPVYHARTKHSEVDYHFIHENVLNDDISIKYISTHDQLADIFTKVLSSARFMFLRDKLMVFSVPISLREPVNNITATSSTTRADTASRPDSVSCLDTCEDSSLVQNTSHCPTTSIYSDNRILTNR
jgi:hypothetical protein